MLSDSIFSFISPTHATCLPTLNRLDLITRTFCEQEVQIIKMGTDNGDNSIGQRRIEESNKGGLSFLGSGATYGGGGGGEGGEGAEEGANY
jgi:hypothetical protein